MAELENIRLHLQKEFSKEPKLNLANEQESRNLEKIALEKVQILEKFEKRNNEIAALAIALKKYKKIIKR